MTDIVAVSLAGISLYMSYKVAGRLLSFLVLANSILILNITGALILKHTVYSGESSAHWLLLVGMYMLNLGAMVTKRFVVPLSHLKHESDDKASRKTLPPGSRRAYLMMIVLYYLVCVIFAVVFFTKFGVPASSSNLEIARLEFQHIPFAFLFYRVFQFAMPFLSIIVLLIYFSEKRVQDLLLFCLLAVLNTAVLYSLGFKGHVFWYGIAICLAIGAHKTSTRSIVWGVGVFSIGMFFAVLGAQRMYKLDMRTAAEKIVQRMTVTNAYGYCILVNEYMQTDNSSEFEGSLNRYLMKWKYGFNTVKAELEVSLTVTLVGTLLYFLGFWGMLLIMLMLGASTHFISVRLLFGSQGPISRTFLIYLLYSILGVLNRGLQSGYILYVLTSIIIMLISTSLIYSVLKFMSQSPNDSECEA